MCFDKNGGKKSGKWQKKGRNGKDQRSWRGYFQTREITNRAFRHCDRTLSPPLPDCSTTYRPEIYTGGDVFLGYQKNTFAIFLLDIETYRCM